MSNQCNHIFGFCLESGNNHGYIVTKLKEALFQIGDIRFDFCPKCGTPLQRYFYDDPLKEVK